MEREREVSSELIIQYTYQQNLIYWSLYVHHSFINNCQNHWEWMQKSLNRKSVVIIQFIKKYDISSMKKQLKM